MVPGRPVLRYFTEADLQPIDPPRAERSDPAYSLRAEDLADLRKFSEEFGRESEVVISVDELERQIHIGMFVRFCAVLGAVTARTTGNVVRIRPSGRLGRHVPEILCTYLENSFKIIDDWNSIHLIPEDKVSALEFLHQMELRRIDQERRAGRRPRTLAERPVAFAIFHAKNDKGESCYLFEVNKDWRRLNLIGGKQEPQDGGDYLETVKREISEELGIGRGRVALTRLNDQPIVGYSLSGNVGSLARYPCVLFGARVEGPLNVRMQDRWLTEATIRKCVEIDDCPIMVNPQYVSYLLAGNPSRLSRMPLSTSVEVRATSLADLVPSGETAPSRWVRVIRENKDLVAAVLTLVAAILTLALAF
jgi:8-oxo-dGTP pyrophosphatase MutT (NUDIX family)